MHMVVSYLCIQTKHGIVYRFVLDEIRIESAKVEALQDQIHELKVRHKQSNQTYRTSGFQCRTSYLLFGVKRTIWMQRKLYWFTTWELWCTTHTHTNMTPTNIILICIQSDQSDQDRYLNGQCLKDKQQKLETLRSKKNMCMWMFVTVCVSPCDVCAETRMSLLEDKEFLISQEQIFNTRKMSNVTILKVRWSGGKKVNIILYKIIS